MPHLSQGEFVEEIAPDIDELMICQPVGVCVAGRIETTCFQGA